MADNSMVMMPEPAAAALLASYGIDYPAHGVARSAGEAVSIAAAIGYPVVLKIVSPQITHKTDAGGVRVGIGDAGEASRAYEEICRAVTAYNPAADIHGVLVCRQEKPGLELVVGKTEDEIFGPVVMFGLGGVFVEILRDVSLRICPIDKQEALRMIGEIRGHKILAGARGARALDIDAVTGLLVRFSRLVAEQSHIAEIDLNPVRVYEKGIAVLDARVICKGG
jgi:acyl-CoA synthetase (NDP forming)